MKMIHTRSRKSEWIEAANGWGKNSGALSISDKYLIYPFAFFTLSLSVDFFSPWNCVYVARSLPSSAHTRAPSLVTWLDSNSCKHTYLSVEFYAHSRSSLLINGSLEIQWIIHVAFALLSGWEYFSTFLVPFTRFRYLPLVGSFPSLFFLASIHLTFSIIFISNGWRKKIDFFLAK